MGMGASSLESFDGADLDVGLAVDAVGAFASAVLQPQLEGVKTQALGELVDDLLRGEGDLGSAGCPVGCRAGFVHHDSVAIDASVGDVIGGEDACGGDSVGRAGIGAGGEGEL